MLYYKILISACFVVQITYTFSTYEFNWQSGVKFNLDWKYKLILLIPMSVLLNITILCKLCVNRTHKLLRKTVQINLILQQLIFIILISVFVMEQHLGELKLFEEPSYRILRWTLSILGIPIALIRINEPYIYKNINPCKKNKK